MELQIRIVALIGLLLLLLEEIKTQEALPLNKCCDLGKNWAQEGLKCEKFSGPVPGISEDEQEFCLHGVNICCIRAYREKSCILGKEDARSGKGCNQGSPNQKKTPIGMGDYRKDCCEGCKLGILTGAKGQGCGLKLTFGKPWDPAFLECCHQASPTTISDESNETSSTYDSTKTTDTSVSLNENETTGSLTTDVSSATFSTFDIDDICQIMKGMLCTDICVPTPGSYYCACNEGSTLLEDGRTCKQNTTSDRCNTSSNPCEQNCTDTGLAVICSCDSGYQLASDGHSCFPVSTEIGNTTTPYEDNEASLQCPAGYRFNSKSQACDDVDECAEGTHSCGREVCYNQPGGFSCARHPTPITRRTAPPFTSSIAAALTKACAEGMRYERNQGCVDINECKEIEDACSSNENCVNKIGGFDCNCKPGFRRDNLTQACIDINECQLKLDNCLPTQRCDNTLGSFNCVRFLSCGTGYTLNAATEICEDDDECALGSHNCVDGYFCRNTLGSFRCYKIKGNFTTTVRPTARRISSRYSSRYTTPFTTTPERTSTMMPTTKSITKTTNPKDETKSTTWMPTERTTLKTTLPVSQITKKPYEARPKIQCPKGYEVGKSGQCIDVNECQLSPNPCDKRNMQFCVNTMGSYRCELRVMCGPGYKPDPTSGKYCVDVDECADKIHECSEGQACENRQGGYMCICPPGHSVGPNKDCVDVDECSLFGSKICGPGGQCQNTVGSFHCKCEKGFENSARAGGTCQDIDECQTVEKLCQHKCSNTWGSYRCSCEPGYRLSSDNRTCLDIDECTEFKDNNLCIGMCENTPGSYKCRCPEGYRIGVDGRTCQDIDECSMGQVCTNSNEMCQNTRGGFRCNKIDCPSGYYLDSDKKNRCVKASRYCQITDQACLRQPSHYSYNFITFVSNLPMPRTGQLELFTMRGTHLPGSTLQFSMSFIEARAPPGVVRATESCFAMRRPASSQVVLALIKPIQGPQEIELDLSMEIYHNTVFVGSAVAKIFIFVSQYEF